jgi:hypothetical protein
MNKLASLRVKNIVKVAKEKWPQILLQQMQYIEDPA